MTFDLTDVEWRKVRSWYKAKHKKCEKSYKFVITSTGIGNVIKAVCRDCKKHNLDLTDYSTW